MITITVDSIVRIDLASVSQPSMEKQIPCVRVLGHCYQQKKNTPTIILSTLSSKQSQHNRAVDTLTLTWLATLHSNLLLILSNCSLFVNRDLDAD